MRAAAAPAATEPDLRDTPQVGGRVQRVVAAVQDRFEAGSAQFVGDGLGLSADGAGVVDRQQHGRRVRRPDGCQALVVGVGTQRRDDLRGLSRRSSAVAAWRRGLVWRRRRLAASEATLRVVGAVVAGAGPGALQALLFSGFGRRLGNQTIDGADEQHRDHRQGRPVPTPSIAIRGGVGTHR